MFQAGDLSAWFLVPRHSAFSVTETHMNNTRHVVKPNYLMGGQGMQKQERRVDISKPDFLALSHHFF